jgi:hypothetical protein
LFGTLWVVGVHVCLPFRVPASVTSLLRISSAHSFPLSAPFTRDKVSIERGSPITRLRFFEHMRCLSATRSLSLGLQKTKLCWHLIRFPRSRCGTACRCGLVACSFFVHSVRIGGNTRPLSSACVLPRIFPPLSRAAGTRSLALHPKLASAPVLPQGPLKQKPLH